MRTLGLRVLYGGLCFAAGAITFKLLNKTPAPALELKVAKAEERPQVPAPKKADDRIKDYGTAEAEKPPTETPQYKYIKGDDLSWHSKKMTERVKRLVDVVMTERDAEYEKLFDEFGVNPETRALLKDRIAHLYRRKAEAGIILSENLMAQLALERQMKAVSPEVHTAYLALEDSIRAKTETDSIATFFEKKGLSLSDRERQKIQEAIQGQGAYTMKTLTSAGSPFDEIALPFGGRAVVPHLQKRYEEVATSSAKLLGDKLGISDQAAKLVEEYFAEELELYQNGIKDATAKGYGRSKR